MLIAVCTQNWSPRAFRRVGAFATAAVTGLSAVYPSAGWLFIPLAAYWSVGMIDMKQTHHTIRRNFPVLGNFRWRERCWLLLRVAAATTQPHDRLLRYVLESIRPEIQQYFIESDTQETPFSRERRRFL